MQHHDISRLRLYHQHLAGDRLQAPEDVVRWLGAVQAQDYAAAKWGIAQRARPVTSNAFDALFADARILRTHALRPTWHFLLPEDIRWVQSLTGPRVHAINTHRYRALELPGDLLARTDDLLADALHGGRQLTRRELADALQQHGITASASRLAYIVMHAELNARICSGGLRGKQFTYALVDERVPPTPPLDRDEALARLAARYFHSHGPATPHDFAWWSGLTLADTQRAIEMIEPPLAHARVHDRTYWFDADTPTPPVHAPLVHLLPNFDEHVVAYRDHAPSFDRRMPHPATLYSEALRAHIVSRNGHIAGGWRRTLSATRASIDLTLLFPFTEDDRAALETAADEYGRFTGLPVEIRGG